MHGPHTQRLLLSGGLPSTKDDLLFKPTCSWVGWLSTTATVKPWQHDGEATVKPWLYTWQHKAGGSADRSRICSVMQSSLLPECPALGGCANCTCLTSHQALKALRLETGAGAALIPLVMHTTHLLCVEGAILACEALTYHLGVFVNKHSWLCCLHAYEVWERGESPTCHTHTASSLRHGGVATCCPWTEVQSIQCTAQTQRLMQEGSHGRGCYACHLPGNNFDSLQLPRGMLLITACRNTHSTP